MILSQNDPMYESLKVLVSNYVPSMSLGERLTFLFSEKDGLNGEDRHFIYVFKGPDGDHSVCFGSSPDWMRMHNSSVAYVLKRSGWTTPNARRLRVGFSQSKLFLQSEIERSFGEAFEGLRMLTGSDLQFVEIAELERIDLTLLINSFTPVDARHKFMAPRNGQNSDFASLSGKKPITKRKMARELGRLKKAKRDFLPPQRTPNTGLAVLVDHLWMPLSLVFLDVERQEVRCYTGRKWISTSMPYEAFVRGDTIEFIHINEETAAMVFPGSVKSVETSEEGSNGN